MQRSMNTRVGCEQKSVEFQNCLGGHMPILQTILLCSLICSTYVTCVSRFRAEYDSLAVHVHVPPTKSRSAFFFSFKFSFFPVPFTVHKKKNDRSKIRSFWQLKNDNFSSIEFGSF